MKPLTAEDLEGMRCGIPGCSCIPEYVNGRCHPNKGVSVRYVRDAKYLAITCKKCGSPIVDIAVARGALP